MFEAKGFLPSPYPGPFKCPDCGAWWAGFYHKCVVAPTVPAIGTSGSFTVKCNCPPNRGPLYKGNCPVHDVQVTYTAEASFGVRA